MAGVTASRRPWPEVCAAASWVWKITDALAPATPWKICEVPWKRPTMAPSFRRLHRKFYVMGDIGRWMIKGQRRRCGLKMFVYP